LYGVELMVLDDDEEEEEGMLISLKWWAHPALHSIFPPSPLHSESARQRAAAFV
jgi:hypothetical protein